MLKFNPAQPHTTTYGPDAAKMPYFQNGLYFNNRGDLVDCDHNRSTLASRGSSFAEATKKVKALPVTPADDKKAPEDPLDAMSPADVFAVAERLRAQLDIANDEDNYVPTLEATDGNVAFIRRHTK